MNTTTPNASLFADRVALVTGAAAGIGEAVARRLVASGARVVVVGHDRAGLDALVAALGTDVAFSLEGDVRDEQAMRDAVEAAVRRFGALHLAVNAAGITGPAGVPVDALAADDWRAVLDTDVTGTFLSMKAELPALVAAGGGAIVNLSSANGLVGLAGMSAYTAAKHAVVGLTRSAALEYAAQGVRVNCVAPGYVATPRMLASPPEVLAEMAAAHPLGRLARREEIADAVSFLLSPASSFMTGAVLSLDGGYTAA
jgi:NAD(P)-dependent dehydrogenase (short-subunit alcohol dehydrogenase family)